jgi:heme exporter protein A
MLTISGLTCARGPRVLFRDLSFVAEPGSIVQITGPNGSGKTTLLRTLAGLTRAESGTIAWSGRGTREHGRAYVGQAIGGKETRSAAENLDLAWKLDAEVVARESGAILGALERVGLGRQRNLPVARLSQGQRKRLHLARLSRSTRALWLLDEPQSSLDDAGQALLDALLAAHVDSGGTAIVAPHHPIAAGSRVIHRVQLSG